MYRLVILALILHGCGQPGTVTKEIKLDNRVPVPEPPPPQTCTVEQTDSGAIITCPDGTSAIISNGTDGNDGQDGQDGQNGQDGADGTNGEQGEPGADGAPAEPCTVEQTNDGAIITCPDGSEAVIVNGEDGEDGEQGEQGEQGEPGTAGQDGADGANCTVEYVPGGADVTCPDGTTVTITNGQDGADGQQGEKGDKGDPGQDGTNGTNGADGQNGQDGADGVDGQDGADGTSCSVLPHPNGAEIVCTDGTSVVINVKKP